MSLELGDHLWYWNGRISWDLDIPCAQWFPGSTGPTDYLGHGKEIYNYVFHADEITRGRPHMRGLEGSYAWLNNNPGNLTGDVDGPDLGQYSGKFNWHHSLIFPSWEIGFQAIALFLRRPPYLDLSLLDVFRRYIPAAEGNDAVSYALEVAAATGRPISARVCDLGDDGMWYLQAKIIQVDRAVAGDIFGYDSPDLPVEIRALLGSSRLTESYRVT